MTEDERAAYLQDHAAHQRSYRENMTEDERAAYLQDHVAHQMSYVDNMDEEQWEAYLSHDSQRQKVNRSAARMTREEALRAYLGDDFENNPIFPSEAPNEVVLGQYERSFAAGRLAFWEQSGHYLVPEFVADDEDKMADETRDAYQTYLEENVLSLKDMSNRMKSYLEKMSDSQPLYTCASCGERGPVHKVKVQSTPISLLKLLRVNPEKVDKVFRMLPANDQDRLLKAYHWFLFQDEYYHLIPFLEEKKAVASDDQDEADMEAIDGDEQQKEPSFPICVKCIKGLRKKLPGQEFSLANNEDYGCMSRCGVKIEEMTIADRLAINPVRLLQSVVKIAPNNRRKPGQPAEVPDKGSYHGHCITFECESLLPATRRLIDTLEQGGSGMGEAGKMELPNTDIHESIRCLFVGYKGDFEPIKAGLPGLILPTTIQADLVYEILKCLVRINPLFNYHVKVDENEDVVAKRKEELQQAATCIMESTVIDNREMTSKRDEAGRSDIARPSEDNFFGNVLLYKPHFSTNTKETKRRFLDIFRKTVLGIDEPPEAELADSMDEKEEGEGDYLSGGDPETTTRLRRGKDPICEFTDMSRIVLLAFPHLFQLGEGYKFKSSIPSRYFEHLGLWYDGRFEDTYFIAFLFNVKQRHQVAREVKAKIVNSKYAQSKFEEILSPNFEKRLLEAMENSSTDDARKIIKMFEYIVKLGTSDVAFSPGQRKGIRPIMAALRYFFSPYTLFNTVAPDILFTPLAIRTMLPDQKHVDTSNESSDTNADDIAKILANMIAFSKDNKAGNLNTYDLVPKHPIRSAMHFYDVMETTAEELWCLPFAHTKKKMSLLCNRKMGVFGLMRSHVGVVEVMNSFFLLCITPTELIMIVFFCIVMIIISSSSFTLGGWT
jgi:hypothetical protein